LPKSLSLKSAKNSFRFILLPFSNLTKREKVILDFVSYLAAWCWRGTLVCRLACGRGPPAGGCTSSQDLHTESDNRVSSAECQKLFSTALQRIKLIKRSLLESRSEPTTHKKRDTICYLRQWECIRHDPLPNLVYASSSHQTLILSTPLLDWFLMQAKQEKPSQLDKCK